MNKYYKFSDGWFTYYVNVATGEMKFSLDKDDVLVEGYLDDFSRIGVGGGGMKIEYKPTPDCCNHYKTNLFTVGYQANSRTGNPSKFKVYICDNCGEVHDPYSGIKGLLSALYFKFISQGCIYIEEEVEE